MFDVFKAARAAKLAKQAVTTVKVGGASLQMQGLPEEYTPAGYAKLAKAQPTDVIIASQPKVVEDEGLSGKSKVPLQLDEAARWCLRDETLYAEAEGKGRKGRKTKTEETPEVNDRGGIDPALNGHAETASV